MSNFLESRAQELDKSAKSEIITSLDLLGAEADERRHCTQEGLSKEEDFITNSFKLLGFGGFDCFFFKPQIGRLTLRVNTRPSRSKREHKDAARCSGSLFGPNRCWDGAGRAGHGAHPVPHFPKPLVPLTGVDSTLELCCRSEQQFSCSHATKPHALKAFTAEIMAKMKHCTVQGFLLIFPKESKCSGAAWPGARQAGLEELAVLSEGISRSHHTEQPRLVVPAQQWPRYFRLLLQQLSANSAFLYNISYYSYTSENFNSNTKWMQTSS